MAVKLPDTLVPMADFPSAYAKDVQFTDGENLQDKLDKGKLGSSSSGTGLTEEQANNIEKIPSIEGIVTSNSQAIANKADKNHKHTEYLTKIPDEYVTDTELSSKGYATETFVTNKIDEASLSGGDVDLSGYATDLSLTGSKLQLKNSTGALIGNPITLPTSSGGGTTEIATVNNGLTFVNPFYGKILNVLGDSQTASNYHKTKIYHDWVKELIGFSTVNNYGFDGATITNISTSRYKYLSEVYSNMSNNADLIIVMAGINELIQKTTIGNPSDTSNTTLYGALKVLFKGLRQKYPGKPIMFITPTHSNNPAVLKGETSCGKTLKEVVEIIIDMCKLYSIPVFDAYSLTGIDPSLYAGTVNTDLLHLNNSGQETLGKMVSNFIIQNFFTMKYTQTSESSKVYGNIVLSTTSLNVNESATTSFTVKLDKAPTDNQTVTLNVNNSNCTLNKNSLTFTPDNYGSAQTVVVTGSHASTDYTNKTSVITATSSNVSSKTINVTIKNIDVEKTLSSISATYNQGATVIYPSTRIEELKNNLVVTANYSDSSTATVTNYSLSGTLSAGTSKITVTYNGKTATFNVTVSEEQQEEPTGWVNRKVTYAYNGLRYFCIGFKNNPSFANGTISFNLSATINNGSFTNKTGGGVFSAEDDTMNNSGYKTEIGKIGTVTWTTEGTSLTMTASPTFKGDVTANPYCKIAFPVSVGEANSSFTINSMELKINGNVVEITNIGGFFTNDFVTVSGATTTTSVTGVTLNKDTLTMNKIGGTQTLSYTITPSNATNKNVTWSTSVPTVASVNNGIVTANANGTTVITIKTTDGGHTDTCTVTVNDPSYVEDFDDTLYVPDIASYGISKDGTNSEATTNGLNRLFADVSTNKKTNVQLPTGTYAINPDISLTPKSNLTLDLNNSKLKIDANNKNGSTMIYLKEVENLTLKNGTIEGDRYDHDYATYNENTTSHEFNVGLKLDQGSRNINIDNVKFTKITGYGLATFQGTQYCNVALDKTIMESGDYNDSGSKVADATKIRYPQAVNITEHATHGYLQVGTLLKYQNYVFNSTRMVTVRMFNASNKLLSKVTSKMYRPIEVPSGATKAYLTFHQSDPKDYLEGDMYTLDVFHMKPPRDCNITNCTFDDNRCLGIAVCGGWNVKIEGNTFKNTSKPTSDKTSPNYQHGKPGYAIDIEDGWESTQDLTINDNTFTNNGYGDIVSLAGDNTVITNNEFTGRVAMYSRNTNYVVKNNTIANGIAMWETEKDYGFTVDHNTYTDTTIKAKCHKPYDDDYYTFTNETITNGQMQLDTSITLKNSTITLDGSTGSRFTGSYDTCTIKNFDGSDSNSDYNTGIKLNKCDVSNSNFFPSKDTVMTNNTFNKFRVRLDNGTLVFTGNNIKSNPKNTAMPIVQLNGGTKATIKNNTLSDSVTVDLYTNPANITVITE